MTSKEIQRSIYPSSKILTTSSPTRDAIRQGRVPPSPPLLKRERSESTTPAPPNSKSGCTSPQINRNLSFAEEQAHEPLSNSRKATHAQYYPSKNQRSPSGHSRLLPSLPIPPATTSLLTRTSVSSITGTALRISAHSCGIPQLSLVPEYLPCRLQGLCWTLTKREVTRATRSIWSCWRRRRHVRARLAGGFRAPDHATALNEQVVTLTRNGGHINPPLYHDYEDLKRDLGKAAAQQIIRF